MVESRIPETNEGIQGEFDVGEYNLFARTMRDRGWMETDVIIKSGISRGMALEIGPGPGYLVLEWLKKTHNTSLVGIEISKNMIAVAIKNAREYGLNSGRARYTEGNAMEMPFADDSFDAVFSGGSLHEWEEPSRIFSQIHRVLKSGGRYCICDLRRDIPFFIKWFFYAATRPDSMRHGLRTSLRASYIKPELENIIAASPLSGACVKTDIFGISISGIKK
jgi:ubiquinone/menaquinone biosynthesis C-methylase UbiE